MTLLVITRRFCWHWWIRRLNCKMAITVYRCEAVYANSLHLQINVLWRCLICWTSRQIRFVYVLKDWCFSTSFFTGRNVSFLYNHISLIQILCSNTNNVPYSTAVLEVNKHKVVNTSVLHNSQNSRTHILKVFTVVFVKILLQETRSN